MKINEVLSTQQQYQIQQSQDYQIAKSQNPNWTPEKWVQAVQNVQGRRKEAPAIKTGSSAVTKGLKGISSVVGGDAGWAVKAQPKQYDSAPVGTQVKRGSILYTKKYQGWADNMNRLVDPNVAQVLDRDWDQDQQRIAKIAGYGTKPDSLGQAFKQGYQTGQQQVNPQAQSVEPVGNVQVENTGIGAALGGVAGAALGGPVGAGIGGYIGSKIGGSNEYAGKVEQPAGPLDRFTAGLGRQFGRVAGGFAKGKGEVMGTTPQSAGIPQSADTPQEQPIEKFDVNDYRNEPDYRHSDINLDIIDILRQDLGIKEKFNPLDGYEEDYEDDMLGDGPGYANDDYEDGNEYQEYGQSSVEKGQ